MINRRWIANAGIQLVSLYYLIMYIVPLIAQTFFEKDMQYVYKVYPLTVYPVFLLVSTFSLYIFLTKYRFNRFLHFNVFKSIAKRVGLIYIHYRWLFAIFVLAISLSNIILKLNLNQYRYSNLSIIEHNSTMLILIIMLMPIVIADLFYAMFVKYKGIRTHFKTRLENICLSISLLLLANGTATAFVALIALLFSFFPNVFINIFFEKKKERHVYLAKRIAAFSCSMLVFACLFLCAWFYGEKVKSGGSISMVESYSLTVNPSAQEKEIFNESNQEAILASRSQPLLNKIHNNKVISYNWTPRIVNRVKGNGDSQQKSKYEFRYRLSEFAELFTFLRTSGWGPISNYIFYVIRGISTSYYTFLFTSQVSRNQLNYGQISPLSFPIQTFFYRLDYLLGGYLDVSRPSIASIAQLNYRLLVKRMMHEREGSSPGLLGSFNYMCIFPFNIIFCVLYLLIISYMVNTLLSNNPEMKLRISGLLVFYLFFQVFFQSPFDFIEIIDNSVIYAALIFGVFLNQTRDVQHFVAVNKPYLGLPNTEKI